MENVIDQEEVMLHKVNRWKKILFVPVLGYFCWRAAWRACRPGDNDRQCDQRIHKAEENLRKAVDRHGEHSSQAEKRRHELEEAKRSCGGDRDRR